MLVSAELGMSVLLALSDSQRFAGAYAMVAPCT